MKNIERMAAAALVVSGCLAPPSFRVEGEGAAPPQDSVITPTPEPGGDEGRFLEEIKEISFKGPDVAVRASHDALRLLKVKTDDYYRYVTTNLKGVVVELDVEKIDTPFTGSAMAMVLETPIRIIMKRVAREAGLIWFAGAFVHESCHIRQYHRFRENFPDKPVPVDRVFPESECHRIGYGALELLGADKETLAYVQGALKDAQEREKGQ